MALIYCGYDWMAKKVRNSNGMLLACRIFLCAQHRCNLGGASPPVSRLYIDTAIATELIRKAASNINDYLIDYDHQSLFAKERDEPSPAAGWFKNLEWREGDGLYVTDARWTDTAAQMLKANEYRYISPVFSYGDTGDVIRLRSAAITNTPALDGLTDLAAATNNPAEQGQDVEQQNAILQAHFGPTAALMSYSSGNNGVIRLSDAGVSGRSDATMSNLDRQQVNEKLTTLFGKNAALI